MTLCPVDEWGASLQTSLVPVLGLLKDPGVTEIEVNAFNEVLVKGPSYRGHVRITEAPGPGGKVYPVCWRDTSDLLTAMKGVAQACGRTIREDDPTFDGRLPDGSRVNMVHPPVCMEGSMTIRKFTDPMTIEKLERKYGALDGRTARFLKWLVLSKQTILVAGGTESGKTSFVNALSEFIPEDQRIVVIEDAQELQLTQFNQVRMETMKPYKPGVKPVTLSDLIPMALRQSPDRIIVGEVRGKEALDAANVFNTGHPGGMLTIHSNSALEALERFGLCMQFAGTSLSEMGIAKLVASSIDIVVYLKKFKEDGSKKLVEILEVDPGVLIKNGNPCYQTRKLVNYEQRRTERTAGGNARIVGDWVFREEPSPRLQAILDQEGFECLDTPAHFPGKSRGTCELGGDGRIVELERFELAAASREASKPA